jgi:signal transduction histidine kinase
LSFSLNTKPVSEQQTPDRADRLAQSSLEGIFAELDERVSHALRDANANVYRVVLGILAAVAILGGLALLASQPSGSSLEDYSRVGVAVATLIGTGIAYQLGRHGRMRLGLTCAFLAIYLAIVTHVIVSGFGIHAYLLATISLIITGSYLLLGSRAGYFSLFLGLTTVGLLYAAEATGVAFHTQIWEIPARNVLAVYSLMYVISAITGARYGVFFTTLVNEVHAQAAQFRDIFLSLPVGAMMSREGRVLLANDQFKSHLGIPLETNIEGVPLEKLAPLEMRERLHQRIALTKLLRIGAFLPPEEFSGVADAQPRTIRIESRKVMLNGQEAMLTISQDVTERNAMLDAIDRERQRAIVAAQAKSTFLATMSHEVRTPLNAVIGLTDLLRGGEVDSATQAKYLKLVSESANALLSLLNDVLDMAQMDAGKLTITATPIDIRALCRSVAQPYETLAHQRGLAFRFHCDTVVPQTMTTDAIRLRQVLGNLLSNALKFTRQGHIAMNVSLRGEAIEIAIEDSGIGISKQDQIKLFAPFVQVNSAMTREFGGSGLGLALCREMLGLMNGTIGLVSEWGQGSRFVVCLPIETSSMSQTSQSASQSATTRQQLEGDALLSNAAVHAPPVLKSTADVLIVEDNMINAVVIAGMLDQANVRYRHVTDGKAAIEACREKHPSLVLLDINLPGMDGFSCAKAIRSIDGMANIPIIACTAWAISPSDPRCLEAGIDDVLLKPLAPHTLQVVLSKLTAEPK